MTGKSARRQLAMALVELAEQMPPPLNSTKAPKALLTASGPNETIWAAVTLLHVITLVGPHWGNSSHSIPVQCACLKRCFSQPTDWFHKVRNVLRLSASPESMMR